MSPGTLALVVHGHRDGNAVGGRRAISDECIARVEAAQRAVKHHGVTEVLLSGAGASGSASEARQMASTWSEPGARLWLDERSTDSAENADEALRWARALGARELIVVSSWWHLRLYVYYRGRRALGPSVRHLRTKRCRHLVRHLAHELRYLPRSIRWQRRDRGDHNSWRIGSAG